MKISVLTILAAALAASASGSLYSQSDSVKSLTAPDFQRIIKTKGEPALVEFFSSGCPHCKSFAPEYEKAAKALEGMIKFYATEDPQLGGSEKIEGVPTVKWYFDGKATEYNGARTADAIVDFVMQKAKQTAKARLAKTGKSSGGQNKSSRRASAGKQKEGVVSLDTEAFNSQLMTDVDNVWFVKFYAPWCGHCKALAPTWEELATRMEGRVRIAKVDATAETELANQFDVKGYPTLIFFPAGKKSAARAIRYSGPRDLEALAQYAMKQAASAIKAKQLLNHDQFVDECDAENTLCMINFLPHIYDSSAKERKSYLKMIKEVMMEKAGLPIKHFWTEAGNSLELERALRLEFGWPAAIIMSAQKQFYATMRGGYTRKNLESFIDSVVMGRQTGEPLPERMPRFPELPAWNGKDAAPLEKKEEDDYGMGEEESEDKSTKKETSKKEPKRKPTGDEL